MPGVTLRGLATIDVDTITDAELDQLHSVGVRGARLHEMAWGHGHQAGGSDIIPKVKRLADRLGRLGWVIGIFCDIRAWAAMAPMIRTELDPRIKLFADHFWGTFPGEESGEESKTFIELIREKRIYVKVSGFERLYHGHVGGMKAIEPIVRAVIEAGPDRIMFGTGMFYVIRL
jgi:predicted TIM-barrel fold metal-dependent hydrolase